MSRNAKIVLSLSSCFIALAVIWLYIGKTIFYNPEREYFYQEKISRIPDAIYFADELVHFKTPTSYQLYYKELKINTNNKASRIAIKNRAKVLLPKIKVMLAKHHIPNDFIYIAIAESQLRNDLVSPRGAKGIWQLTAETAIQMGLKVDDQVDERLDIDKSTKAACKLIKLSHKKFGNWTSAAAAYNRGINGLEKAMIKQGKESYYDLDLNKETAKYIYKILSYKKMMRIT